MSQDSDATMGHRAYVESLSRLMLKYKKNIPSKKLSSHHKVMNYNHHRKKKLK